MGAYIKAKTRLTMNCSARMCGFASNMNRRVVVVLFCTFFRSRAVPGKRRNRSCFTANEMEW